MIRDVYKICRVPGVLMAKPWIRSGWTRWRLLQTEYMPPGGRTFPQLEGTPLFAYTTLERAKADASTSPYFNQQIYLAEASIWTGPAPGLLSLPSLAKHEMADPRMTAEIVKDLWATGKLNYPDTRLWRTLEGTILCDWIELLERVGQPPDTLQKGDRSL